MTKDRSRRIDLDHDTTIFVERSSTHPIEYAIRLCVRRDGGWRTMHLFDNSHGPEEHHEHRYVGEQKQPPLVSHGPVNEAMARAALRLQRVGRDIVNRWEMSS